MNSLANKGISAALRGVALYKTFALNDLEVHALHDVTVDIERGKLTAVMGPSGSGKSTLLHVLGGIDRPTSGEVYMEGSSLSDLSDYERTIVRRRKMGFVFQSFNLFPSLNVISNVMMPLRFDGIELGIAHQRAMKALSLVGLDQRAAQTVSALSGGERQRIAIARALVIEPTIILADEPTGNLDSAATKNIVDLLRRMVRDIGQSVLLVTHDPRIGETADRLIEFADGRIVADSAGLKSDLTKDSKHD